MVFHHSHRTITKTNYKRRTTQIHKNSVCHKIQGENTSFRGLPKKNVWLNKVNKIKKKNHHRLSFEFLKCRRAKTLGGL